MARGAREWIDSLAGAQAFEYRAAVCPSLLLPAMAALECLAVVDSSQRRRSAGGTCEYPAPSTNTRPANAYAYHRTGIATQHKSRSGWLSRSPDLPRPADPGGSADRNRTLRRRAERASEVISTSRPAATAVPVLSSLPDAPRRAVCPTSPAGYRSLTSGKTPRTHPSWSRTPARYLSR